MSKFKTNPMIPVYYSDTDSLFTTLPPSQRQQLNVIMPGAVSQTELGKLKLEASIKKAVFLAPKAYYYETTDGRIVAKVKGVNKVYLDAVIQDNTINFKIFSDLLNKETILKLNNERWFRDSVKGTITISKSVYQLKQTESKRKLIYIDDKCVRTEPITLND